MTSCMEVLGEADNDMLKSTMLISKYPITHHVEMIVLLGATLTVILLIGFWRG